jgi:hypothetical protein
MAREQRRMEADGLETRRVQNALGHDDRDESHDGEVSIERANLIELAFAAQGGRLTQRQTEFERFGLERIGAGAGSVGRREDVDDFLALRVQRLKGFLSERGLTDQNDAHYIHLHCEYVRKANKTVPPVHAAAWRFVHMLHGQRARMVCGRGFHPCGVANPPQAHRCRYVKHI